MAESLFLIDGDTFVPTELARGPWSPQALHGGPPAALLARAVAQVDGGATMLVARMTVELLRPVPVAPLRLSTRVVRPGKKVQLVEAGLFAAETEVARCTALRMRQADVPVPAGVAGPAPPPAPSAGTGTQSPWNEAISYRAFHNDGVEHRFVTGSFAEAGPATDWIRLRVPLIQDEPILPLCRVVAAADFGNGVSWVLNRRDGYTFINPDLTVYLQRYPRGEWVCLDARTDVAEHGIGLAESQLFDEQGAIGRAVQSLLIDRLPT